MKKRDFLKYLSLGVITPTSLLNANPNLQNGPDDFWDTIRSKYKIKPDYINLENGYYCFIPNDILEKYQKYIDYVNREGSFYMRKKLYDDKIAVRKSLASLVGCDFEEIIITRNTTESLDTIIAGYDWKPGDEAVMAEQDYGAMLDMFKLQAKRFGMTNKIVSIPNHPSSDEEIVKIYENAITPKTKLLMVCHMINITGHILPIKKICEMAHRHGVDVMVDGAHAIGHFEFKISDLDCDYYGSSLHKWLSVPLGAGLLYVRKEKIAKVWQLFGDMGHADDKITKLNHTGTQPIATELTIPDSIDFYKMIGGENKENRLRYLKDYWVNNVKDIPNVLINTPYEKERSCGIANVGVPSIKPAELSKILFEKYQIFTVAIDYANVHGCRITPNIYTTTEELDKFIIAIKEIAKSN
ncbi:MAG: aminotransferase class V-fold PLP-dependent enzyme [Saprospiraceae bacterium]|nr:aminotransferase class V-fold PLP-dependent enzyme [Saprospiraceae bacterium]